jgi:hypothetical protein
MKTYDRTPSFKLFDQQKLSSVKSVQSIHNQNISESTMKPSENRSTNSKSFKTSECSKNYRTTSTISSDATKETTMLTEKSVSFEIAKQTTISK